MKRRYIITSCVLIFLFTDSLFLSFYLDCYGLGGISDIFAVLAIILFITLMIRS